MIKSNVATCSSLQTLNAYSAYLVDVAGLPNVNADLLQLQRLDIAISPMF